jgi:hypothetical protein
MTARRPDRLKEDLANKSEQTPPKENHTLRNPKGVLSKRWRYTMTAPKDKNKFFPSIPKRELEALARCLLPAIQEYFESEEGQREFAEWEAQQKQ